MLLRFVNCTVFIRTMNLTYCSSSYILKMALPFKNISIVGTNKFKQIIRAYYVVLPPVGCSSAVQEKKKCKNLFKLGELKIN